MSPAPKTPEDKAKLIASLKDKVSPYLTDEYWTSDDYLYKWIQDRMYSVEKAEKALRKCLKWRLDNKIDGILEENFEDLHKNLVYYIDGRDNSGRVVLTIPCNLCSMKDAFEAGNKDRLMRFFRQMIEHAAAQIRSECLQNPGSPSTIACVIDFDGVDMTKSTPEVVNFCISTATSLEDNYPGQTEYMYIINASKGVKNMYTFAKSALRKNTIERIKIFGKKRHKWEPVVLAVITADQIRQRFGGTMKDETVAEIQDLNINFENLDIKE